MPIPALPSDATVAGAITALFRQVHDELRIEISGLDDDDLNWAPAVGANSIATIVTHLLGSEAETLTVAAGQPCDRDRDSEFVASAASRQDVLEALVAADALLDDLSPFLVDARLTEPATLPTLPASEVRPTITWLIGNYGHAREHVGHIQVTKQLRHSAAK